MNSYGGIPMNRKTAYGGVPMPRHFRPVIEKTQGQVNTTDPLTCPDCGFTAKSRIGLIGHSKTHQEKANG
jgi:hypothetical protein